MTGDGKHVQVLTGNMGHAKITVTRACVAGGTRATYMTKAPHILSLAKRGTRGGGAKTSTIDARMNGKWKTAQVWSGGTPATKVKE